MAAPLFRIKRNGVVLATWQPPYGKPPEAGGVQVPFVPGGTATRTILDTPGGPAVYTLEVIIDGSISSAAGEVYHRSLLVQGVKR